MNNIFCPESEMISAKKKKVMMKELVKGHEAASKLKLLLEKPYHHNNEHSLTSQHQLMANVLTSFTQSLSIITSSSSSSSSSSHHFPHLNLLNSGQNGSPVPPSGIDPSIGDSSETKKMFQKGGRGRYNRRRNVLTWNKISCTTEDNHAWRKYGQKGILNSDFPRSYFRCIHKYDQGCRATKQVQRDQDNPDMYLTTYIGIHTCNNAATPKATHSTTDSDHICSPTLTTMKQEFPKENASSEVTDDKLDPLMWSDLKDFEPYIQAYHCDLGD